MEQLEVICAAGHELGVRASEYWRKLPLQFRIPAGFLLVVLVLAGLHAVFTWHDSILHLRLQHSLRNGQITVFVDDSSVYSGKLTAVVKKKFGLFGDTLQGTLSQEIPVSSGVRRVRVQITSSDGTVQQDSIAAEFSRNGEGTLLVDARRGAVVLNWLGGSASASDNTYAATSSEGWLSRNATTLLMTIAGSIISAITGFALKAIPGYLKSRQTSQ